MVTLNQSAATQVVYYEPYTRAFPALMSDRSPHRSWADAVAEIRELARLVDDWDEAGALAPSRELVYRAIDFAAFVRQHGFSAPEIVRPTPDGNISLEWHAGMSVREVELTPNGMSIMDFDTATGRSSVAFVPA